MPECDTSEDKVLFVTGCGRSGTTIAFSLLKTNSTLKLVKLDEPREIYLSYIGPCFDIWSALSRSRKGVLNPQITNPLSSVLRQIDNNPITYIEKMPEHILRVSQLTQASP